MLAALAALALATPGVQAAPAPQVTDPAGDWYVPSQDVVSGRISSVLIRGVPHLRGELRLSAPPAIGVPSTYDLTFRIRCTYYSFALAWDGMTPSGAAFDHWDWCYEDPEPYGGPEGKLPVTFSVRGSTLTFLTPYVAGIRRGQRVTRFGISACPQYMCGVSTRAPDVDVRTGDLAGSNASYVVGSDLPRR